MKFLRLLTLIMAVPIICLAQSNYKNGYLIKLNGDTVRGEVNYREWHTSPKSILFRQDNHSQPYEVAVRDVKGLNITGYEKFISYTGPVSTSTVSYINLPNYLDTAVRTDTVFLNVVYTGSSVSLLSHTDEVKTRFFVMDGNKFQELKYYQHYNTDGSQVVTVDTYKRQLIALLAKYNANYDRSSFNEIQKAAYYVKDLVKALKLINVGSPASAEQVSKDLSKLRFFAGAGVAYTAYEFNGPKDFGYESNHAYVSPLISLGVDFLKNAYIQKYFFRLELSGLRNTPYYTGTYSYYTYTETKATLTPQLVWNVYNTPKLKYFFNVGIAFSYGFISNNKLVATEERRVADPHTFFGPYDSRGIGAPLVFKNPYNIQSGVIGVPLKTGLVFNRRAEIFIMYRPVISGSQKDYDAINKYTLATGLSYYFGKN